jgi:hypothetical protein
MNTYITTIIDAEEVYRMLLYTMLPSTTSPPSIHRKHLLSTLDFMA